MSHAITIETEPNRQNGNLTRHRTVCTCGWKGVWRSEYEDTMDADLRRDETYHSANPTRA